MDVSRRFVRRSLSLFPFQAPIDHSLIAVRSYYHAFRKLVKPPLSPTDIYDLQVAVVSLSLSDFLLSF